MKVPEILTCRRILYAMMITAFIVFALNVIIFPVAIVAMVEQTNRSSSFDWTENQKQNVLAVGLVGEALGKLINGRLSEVIGPRRMIGYSIFLAGVITVVTPQMALWNYYLLIVSRIVLSLLVGAMFPCAFLLAAKWFHPEAQTKFLSCMEALSLGVAMTNLLGGFIISHFGWACVFYVFGGVSVLWSLVWFLLIWDTPEVHPRISGKEKREIQGQIGDHSNRPKIKFIDAPWKEIITSTPIWAIVIAEIAAFFICASLQYQLPSYINQIMKYDIEDVGLYSSIPYLGKYLCAIVFTNIADLLIKYRKLSNVNIRRMLEVFGILIPSLCMVALALYGNNVTISMTAFVLLISLSGASVGGHLANILDIAPNYSGTISGLAIGLATIGGYCSSIVVTSLLQNGHTFQEWQSLFWILFGVGITGWTVYVCFSSSKLQNWDYIEEPNIPDQRSQ